MVRVRRSRVKGRATITEVAKKAGVSIKTVSNAINSPAIVRPKTRQRVLRAIQSLDYHPSAAAQSLVTRRSQLIGLLLFDITNPAYPEIAEMVIDRARHAGFTVLVCNAGRDPAEQNVYVDLLIRQQADGVIVAVQQTDGAAAKALMRRGIKVVQLNRHAADSSLPYVGLDNEHGGYLATKHLLDLGHRRIAFIRGVTFSSTSQEREAGYLRALAECGITPDPTLICTGEFSAERTREVAKELLSRTDRPTAIFAAADTMALGVMDAAAQMGLQIPEHLALVGFDDIALASNAAISLTTVRGGLGKLGEETAEFLLQLIKNNGSMPTGEPMQRILPVTLQIRRSSGAQLRRAAPGIDAQ